jgi:hypothetical protein
VKNISILVFLAVIGWSCEKEIFPDLGDPFQIVSIDALITDQGTTQSIYVTSTQPYFENEFPTKIDGAIVGILDQDSTYYPFIENDTAYTWVSPDGQPFGNVGSTYYLIVQVEGQTYLSFSQMTPSPQIDSIKWEFFEGGGFVPDDYYLSQFYAKDRVGSGDAYWIRAYKNGVYLNKPSEINVAFDAGFSEGSNVDGIVFVQPIRQGINPFDTDENNRLIPPYLPGDSVGVSIYSISPEMYYYLLQVGTQTAREGGFAELFASPITNVPTNIFNEDENSTVQPVGFFNVSSVTSFGQTLTEELAEEARELHEKGL